MCPENCKLLLYTELHQALVWQLKRWCRSGRESSEGKSILLSLGFVGYPSYSRVVERSCHFTENSWKLLQVQLRKKWEPVANVNPVGEIWWRPLELKKFQKWGKFGGGSQRIPITFAIVTATSKVKLFKSLGTVGYLNTWLPRSIFIYTSNTLLTAGCCRSELRYLKHWHRLLCPGLVKPILGHSFGRS